MSMKIRFSGIQWDTEGQAGLNLPAEVTLPVPAGFDAAEDGADLLADRYGWCVTSFSHSPVAA